MREPTIEHRLGTDVSSPHGGSDSLAVGPTIPMETPRRPPRRRARQPHAEWTMDSLRPYDRLRPPIRGICAEDLIPAYQPIVELRTADLFAYEATVTCRWKLYEKPHVLFGQAMLENAEGRLGRVMRSAVLRNPPTGKLFVQLRPGELTSRWPVRPDDPLYASEREVYLEVSEEGVLHHFDIVRGALNEIRDRSGAKLVIDASDALAMASNMPASRTQVCDGLENNTVKSFS